MKRKFEIPKMKKKDIKKWHEAIKPIVNDGEKAVYLRKLNSRELSCSDYTGFMKPSDYAGDVDFLRLSHLADVKMLHVWDGYGHFKPTVEEIIRQIPSEMLDKVVAFEMIYSTCTEADYDLFKQECYARYHVSVVRLYQDKNDLNNAAEPVDMYPAKESTLPIGMTEKEFERLKEIYGVDN